MTTMKRREFVRGSAMSVGAAFLANRAGFAATQNARIEILLNEPLGTISPDIYGHFTEHLGGVIYDGVWVGEDSKVAATIPITSPELRGDS